MTPTADVQPGSSPALEVPREPKAYAEWRSTGKLPEAKESAPKGESAPPQDSSAEGHKPEEKAAPASEAGKGTQENKNKPQRDNAAARLSELLEDLRRAGYTPAELKTLKREVKADQQAEPPKAAPEKTDNPAELKAPVKPKIEDYKTLDEYDAARDKYYEDFAEYKAEEKHRKFLAEQRDNAARQSVHEKMQEAKGRYGDEAVGIISSTARAITGDQQIPQAVKAILEQSPVWTDLLYTLGGKAEDLDAFIQLSKSDPGAAIRKAVLMEQLVTQELAKPARAEAGDGEATPRGEDGKFKKTTPEKKESNAPPPPREVSGRGTPPADPVEQAVKASDFRSYMRSANERDMSSRRR